MKWPGPVVVGRFIKRYKRFLADFRLQDGTVVTAHCANTGSMKTCLHDNSESWLTYHPDPKRKLKYSWQAIHMPDGWVGINTAIANGLVKEAIQKNLITELAGYQRIATERKYGANSRIDILLSDDRKPDCFVEVKNVTLMLRDGVAGFPDAVTQRGTKHLQELAQRVLEGQRAVLCYCVQRCSASLVSLAQAQDPHYAQTLRWASSAGVEVLAYQAAMNPQSVQLVRSLPVVLGLGDKRG